uniref:CSON009356 protein n=1 Tax=Culicoides sonorensis TaxID=179676 RepID=A0A336K5J5_CULSO
MYQRKSVIVLAHTGSSDIISDENDFIENSYCGYCCKLIEINKQNSQGEKSFQHSTQNDNNDTNNDDHQFEYIILCENCKGPFHVQCTALSSTPTDKIREQSLNWKCNSCVKFEAPNVDNSSDIEESKPVIIEYMDKDRDKLINLRLSTLLSIFGNDRQKVCGRVIETNDIANELSQLKNIKSDELLIVDSVPVCDKDQLLKDITRIAFAKGIKLIPVTKQTITNHDNTDSKTSLIIHLDYQTTRQILLNSYLNSIMHPITTTHNNHSRPTSFYLANERDIEVTSTTCLLPHTTTITGTTITTKGIEPRQNNHNRSIYMYEYLSINAPSSEQNQTMLVKSIGNKSATVNCESDNESVFNDEATSVIVPIIKISSVPKRVRLASKENFDDIEDNNNNNLPPIQSSSSIVSIVSTASVAGSEPSDGNSEGQIIPEKKEKIIPHEPWWHTTLQISIPFFLAGIGTVGAGIILGFVEHWDVFKDISELFILIPSLLGLKGNLDMCLASRLSTQANLGNMTSKKVILKMIIGNIALVQIQATVAAFIVSIFAIGVGQAMNGAFDFRHACVVTAAAMFTATSSCFVLDFFLIAMVLASIKLKMNPDNLATPLAASIGDVVSISVFSFIASFLYRNHDTHLWTTFVVVAIYFLLLPCWIIVVLKNEYTHHVLKSGWVPVLSALFISGLGGLVLDKTIGKFHGFVVFQPIINGIGGNLVSVQASKISTMLHQSSILGIIPPYTKIIESPFRSLIKGVPYAKTARILLCMTIPALLFIFFADMIHTSTITIDYVFTFVYWIVSFLQVSLLLYTAHVIIHFMWRHKIDPDNSAIPYLTAIGDFVGTCLLFIAFWFLELVGHGYNSEKGTGD